MRKLMISMHDFALVTFIYDYYNVLQSDHKNHVDPEKLHELRTFNYSLAKWVECVQLSKVL